MRNSLTTVRKQVDGWEAKTEIDLGHHLVLYVTTRRRMGSSNLSSVAHVGHLDKGFVCYTVARDFWALVDERSPSRVTESVIRVQHQRAVEQIDSLSKLALRFYGHDLTDVATPPMVEACDVPY